LIIRIEEEKKSRREEEKKRRGEEEKKRRGRRGIRGRREATHQLDFQDKCKVLVWSRSSKGRSSLSSRRASHVELSGVVLPEQNLFVPLGLEFFTLVSMR
jgi:hypothetical protein